MRFRRVGSGVTMLRHVKEKNHLCFHAGGYFGKGSFSWAVYSGKPNFAYELYLQPEPGNRDLRSHALPR
jgi:hypothetical protein